MTFEGELLIERYFRLTENQTTVRQELLGGLTTFLTMAYIIVVNPQILSQAATTADALVPRASLPALAAAGRCAIRPAI